MAALAVTGGTGFVGQRLLRLATAQGHEVRALARSNQPRQSGVEWIPGDLTMESALARLCAGADAVIHLAGTINAWRQADYDTGNVAGTGNMLSAARLAGVRRFIHVSSLAAREPSLSRYGRSKSDAESLVRGAHLDWTIARPPGVYGPGDRETLALFKLAQRGFALTPMRGRGSWIHVDDLAAALLVLAQTSTPMRTFEVAGPEPDGLGHAEFAQLLGAAVDRQVRIIPIPKPLMMLAAAGDSLAASLSGRLPKLSFDRARYFCHPDWVSRGPAIPGWIPRIGAAEGIAATADWYRAAGWL